jgi:hypothetical protein
MTGNFTPVGPNEREANKRSSVHSTSAIDAALD